MSNKDQKEDYVVHYTCNSPAEDVLKKHGIRAVGEAYNLSPREMLEIPKSLIEKGGRKVDGSLPNLVSVCEQVIRDIK